jgi:plastocyanin
VHHAARTPRRRLAALAILGVASLSLLAFAGCGDDEEEEAATAPTATETTAPSGAAGKAQEVDVSETEYKLDPADPTVKPGTVTFKATNDGQAVHNLEIEGDGVEEELPEDLQAGDSGELTVDLEPGTYEMYCPVANHAELGMEGEVTVEE